MTRMNSRVDEIQDFVKTNVQPTTDKKGKQVTFTDQLPSQATANPRNQGASSTQTHNINHVHVDEEAVESALAISSLRSGKALSDPYKDHPFLRMALQHAVFFRIVEALNSMQVSLSSCPFYSLTNLIRSSQWTCLLSNIMIVSQSWVFYAWIAREKSRKCVVFARTMHLCQNEGLMKACEAAAHKKWSPFEGRCRLLWCIFMSFKLLQA